MTAHMTKLVSYLVFLWCLAVGAVALVGFTQQAAGIVSLGLALSIMVHNATERT